MTNNSEKVNKKVTKGFQPLNRVELLLGAFLKHGHATSGYFTSGYDGFYNAGDNRYLSYGKHKCFEEKIALMIKLFEKPYTFKQGNSDKGFKIFSFTYVRKNYEHKITQALTARPEHAQYYWERWCLFRDGTILEPELTEKFLKKVNVQRDQKLREENDYLDALLSRSNLRERNDHTEDIDEIPF